MSRLLYSTLTRLVPGLLFVLCTTSALAAALTLGTPTRGTITKAGQKFAYTFSATTGDVVNLVAQNTTAPPSDFALSYQLLAPDKTPVSNSGYSPAGAGSYTNAFDVPLPQTGTYSVVVADDSL